MCVPVDFVNPPKHFQHAYKVDGLPNRLYRAEHGSQDLKHIHCNCKHVQRRNVFQLDLLIWRTNYFYANRQMFFKINKIKWDPQTKAASLSAWVNCNFFFIPVINMILLRVFFIFTPKAPIFKWSLLPNMEVGLGRGSRRWWNVEKKVLKWVEEDISFFKVYYYVS